MFFSFSLAYLNPNDLKGGLCLDSVSPLLHNKVININIYNAEGMCYLIQAGTIPILPKELTLTCSYLPPLEVVSSLILCMYAVAFFTSELLDGSSLYMK